MFSIFTNFTNLPSAFGYSIPTDSFQHEQQQKEAEQHESQMSQMQNEAKWYSNNELNILSDTCNIQSSFKQVASFLTQQQAQYLFEKLQSFHAKVDLFLHVSEAVQNHMFPLLPLDVQEYILVRASNESFKSRLIEQQAGFDKFTTLAHHTPESPETFFYIMALHNAQVNLVDSEHITKISYIISADKIVGCKLKPFKYQRALMKQHVQTIASGVCITKALFQPIILAWLPDKKMLSILDGQHRWNAIQSLSQDIAATVQVQIDVLVLQDNDEDVMKLYKNINTTVPIDHQQLQEELKYISLVERIKAEFPKTVRSFTKITKELKQVPEHLVIDSMLKEELHYRNVLQKMKDTDVILLLRQANEYMKTLTHLHDEMNLIDRKICSREKVFLGMKWPMAIDLIEQFHLYQRSE